MIIVPAPSSVPPLLALDGRTRLPGLLLNVEAARALVPAPAVSPVLSRDVAVGLRRGEQPQHGGRCPGRALGTGGLGARGVWPGWAAARPPGARAVQDAGKQMVPCGERGVCGRQPARGKNKSHLGYYSPCGFGAGDVEVVGMEGGLSRVGFGQVTGLRGGWSFIGGVCGTKRSALSYGVWSNWGTPMALNLPGLRVPAGRVTMSNVPAPRGEDVPTSLTRAGGHPAAAAPAGHTVPLPGASILAAAARVAAWRSPHRHRAPAVLRLHPAEGPRWPSGLAGVERVGKRL